MKIKLVNYKSRFIADLSKTVFLNEEIEVDDKIGNLLLKHNTDTQKVWEEIKIKKVRGTK